MPDTLPQWLVPESGPATLKTRPWGGTRLAELRKAPASIERPIGESWEFSTLPGSESRTGGCGLAEALGAPLPFLVKLIDTARPLSVQLHPADDLAAGVVGKEEAWIVLDAEPGATVFAGLRAGTTHEELVERTSAAVANPAVAGAALLELMHPVPVQRGSVVFVPARTIHAIQGGIMLAEIQQPSDCTYRLFDYGSGRETHVEAVLEHIDVQARAPTWQPNEPASELVGQHLKLSVLRGPVSRRLSLEPKQSPRLLVGVQGPIDVRSADGREALEAGTLRLHHRGEIEIALGKDALLVVGQLA